VIWEPLTKVAWHTGGRDLDDGIVGMLDLWLRHLSDTDLEGLLVVNCFHHGGCCGRHCDGVLFRKMGSTKELRWKKDMSGDLFSP